MRRPLMGFEHFDEKLLIQKGVLAWESGHNTVGEEGGQGANSGHSPFWSSHWHHLLGHRDP